MKRGVVLGVVVGVLAVILAGCGGGSKSIEQQIADVETQLEYDAASDEMKKVFDEGGDDVRHSASEYECHIVGTIEFTGSAEDVHRCFQISEDHPDGYRPTCVVRKGGTLYAVTDRIDEIETTSGKAPDCNSFLPLLTDDLNFDATNSG